MVETFTPGAGIDMYTDGIRQMLYDGDYSSGMASVANYKAQVMTKYMLLERLAATLKCAPGDKFVVGRVDSTTQIHSKIQGVLKKVDRWPLTCQAIKDHFMTFHEASESVSTEPPPGNLTPEQEGQYREIEMFFGARRNFQKSRYATVEGNIQLMALMVHWHSTVSPSIFCGGTSRMNEQPSAQHPIPTG